METEGRAKGKGQAGKVGFFITWLVNRHGAKVEIRVNLASRGGVKLEAHMSSCPTGPLVPGQVLILKEMGWALAPRPPHFRQFHRAGQNWTCSHPGPSLNLGCFNLDGTHGGRVVVTVSLYWAPDTAVPSAANI